MLLKFSLQTWSASQFSPCHICATCGKQFYEEYNLEVHIITHDSEKFFSCVYPNCTRRYKSKVGYNQHIKTHMDWQSEFSCPVCDKGFDFKKYLDEHLKVHSNDLPQKCPYCNKWYKWRSSVEVNIKLNHPEFAKRQWRIQFMVTQYSKSTF